MNSLEFIEKEINHWNKVIKHQPSSNDVQKHLNDKLQTLYQIKSELEAWEVVKHTIYKRKMGEESFIQVMGGIYNEGQCWTSGINPYEIIKKALEVEE